MIASVPYRPETPREASAWFALWPTQREALNLAWVQWLPAARATERRHRRAAR